MFWLIDNKIILRRIYKLFSIMTVCINLIRLWKIQLLNSDVFELLYEWCVATKLDGQSYYLFNFSLSSKEQLFQKTYAIVAITKIVKKAKPSQYFLISLNPSLNLSSNTRLELLWIVTSSKLFKSFESFLIVSESLRSLF